MWMPLWTLSWFCIASLTSSLAVGQQSPQLDLESRTSLFLSEFNSNYVPFFVYLLSSLPFSWFCLRKLESHKLMLDQMSQFDLRHAKCSLESDRKLIEEQVLQLFDEALEPPVQVCFCAGAHAYEDDDDDHKVLVSPEDIQEIRHITSYPSRTEVVEQFNAYVRGPLSDIVVRSVGKEQSISCKLCFVVSFPLWLLGLVFVLGCDGRSECETSAIYSGYSSVSQYMAANAAINLLLQPLVNVLGLPLMLRANHLVTTCFAAYSFQILAGSILSGLVLKLMDNLFFAQRGMMVVVVTRFSTTWLAGAHKFCFGESKMLPRFGYSNMMGLDMTMPIMGHSHNSSASLPKPYLPQSSCLPLSNMEMAALLDTCDARARVAEAQVAHLMQLMEAQQQNQGLLPTGLPWQQGRSHLPTPEAHLPQRSLQQAFGGAKSEKSNPWEMEGSPASDEQDSNQSGRIERHMEQDQRRLAKKLRPKQTLRGYLEELRSEDPRCIFIVRRINKLGFRSKSALESHYSKFGKVLQVCVAHSKVKPLPNSGQTARTRPGNFGLVVMQSPAAVKKA
eukprot:s1517_g17.t1